MERSLTETTTIRLLGEQEHVQVAIALINALEAHKRRVFYCFLFFWRPHAFAEKGKVNRFGSKQEATIHPE